MTAEFKVGAFETMGGIGYSGAHTAQVLHQIFEGTQTLVGTRQIGLGECLARWILPPARTAQFKGRAQFGECQPSVFGNSFEFRGQCPQLLRVDLQPTAHCQTSSGEDPTISVGGYTKTVFALSPHCERGEDSPLPEGTFCRLFPFRAMPYRFYG
ncbi:hypothetical protein [Nocardia brevicatena]|uniref:hypothetical protein n=1 Tax=Nocardia brevicatena TaxID=37327 RepID=UPI0005928034|nr:hypothetical protein [Nocardia brevicatena]